MTEETKYRMLEEGEIIREGDEFDTGNGDWLRSAAYGEKHSYPTTYRRPITCCVSCSRGLPCEKLDGKESDPRVGRQKWLYFPPPTKIELGDQFKDGDGWLTYVDSCAGEMSTLLLRRPIKDEPHFPTLVPALQQRIEELEKELKNEKSNQENLFSKVRAKNGLIDSINGSNQKLQKQLSQLTKERDDLASSLNWAKASLKDQQEKTTAAFEKLSALKPKSPWRPVSEPPTKEEYPVIKFSVNHPQMPLGLGFGPNEAFGNIWTHWMPIPPLPTPPSKPTFDEWMHKTRYNVSQSDFQLALKECWDAATDLTTD